MRRSAVAVNLLTILNGGDITYAEEREALQTAIEEFLGPQLVFADIRPGEHFIVFPQAGDDAGHGGFKAALRVFKKARYLPGIAFSGDCVESHMPADMPVIRVLIDGPFDES